jgi:hypothetical protein
MLGKLKHAPHGGLMDQPDPRMKILIFIFNNLNNKMDL